MPIFDGRFDQFLSVDGLRAADAAPELLGTGSVKVKLNDRQRIYLWHPDLTVDIESAELRDRRHFFTSHVVSGELTIEEWSFQTNDYGDHQRIYGRCQSGAFQEFQDDGFGRVEKGASYTLAAGSKFSLPPDRYYRFRASRCVMLLERGEILTDFASVVRPLGSLSANYNEISEARLWECIAELLA
jgi:hypothetical protein